VEMAHYLLLNFVISSSNVSVLGIPHEIIRHGTTTFSARERMSQYSDRKWIRQLQQSIMRPRWTMQLLQLLQ
ncbi:hypothetical protein PFISCL1PPCAC_11721, partial [Pristionchus fissidentatus]